MSVVRRASVWGDGAEPRRRLVEARRARRHVATLVTESAVVGASRALAAVLLVPMQVQRRHDAMARTRCPYARQGAREHQLLHLHHVLRGIWSNSSHRTTASREARHAWRPAQPLRRPTG